MKKRISISILASMLLFASCNELLDLYPLDKVATSTFWKTEGDFENALTSCYGMLQQEFFAIGQIYWDAMSDDGYCQHNWYWVTNMAQGTISPTSDGFLITTYQMCYRSIARSNIFLYNLKGLDGIDANKKIRWEAEARMLRAYFYGFLYRCYKDLPIIKEPLDLDNQYVSASPRAEMLSFIMDELDFCIRNLDDRTYKESGGHWTVNAARGFKARMLLYDAYDANKNAIASQMQEVLTVLNQISGYRLADDYSDNFHDLQQENCPEIMMSVKWLAPNNRNQSDLWYADWVLFSPTAGLISLYDMADGSPGEPVPYTGRGVVDMTKFTNASLLLRESRCDKSIFIDYYKDADRNEYRPSNARPLNTGVQKYLTPTLAHPYTNNSQTQHDWIIVRYADVLLMKAEAENELNGPTEVVYNAINDIRERAGTSMLPAGLTKDEMRERIRRERRIELAFEGHRYFDLKRWKIAKEVLNAVEDGLIVYHFEDKHYFWPIPQREIDKNNGHLVQNPDYQ